MLLLSRACRISPLLSLALFRAAAAPPATGAATGSVRDESPAVMDEVVVTASRETPEPVLENPASQELADDELARHRTATLGDTLASQPGVRATSFAPGASRPVLRGADGARTPIQQEGLPALDVSGLSPDHAVSFSSLLLDAVEIQRGPWSLANEGNPVTGVVEARDGRVPREPLDGWIGGKAAGGYSSPASAWERALRVEGGAEDWAWRVQGARSESDDLEIPGFARSRRLREREPLPEGEREARGTLPNSAAESQGGSAGLTRFGAWGRLGAAVSGFESVYGSPAEEGVSIDMQQRRLDLQGQFLPQSDWLESIDWALAHTDYEHVELEGSEAHTRFRTDGYSGRLDFHETATEHWEGRFGLTARANDFSASGAEAFLPATESRAGAIYLLKTYHFSPEWALQGGGRLGLARTEAAASGDFGSSRNRDFVLPNLSLGLAWTPDEDWHVALDASYSSRAPEAVELFARGPHLATAAYEIGDDSLDPESSVGLNLGVARTRGRMTGSVNAFVQRYESYIALNPTGDEREFEHGHDDEEEHDHGHEEGDAHEPDGGHGHEDHDHLLTEYAYEQTRAVLYGLEGTAVFHLIEAGAGTPRADALDLELGADYLRGRDLQRGDSLARIAPFRLRSALSWSRGNLGARVEGIYSAAQHETAEYELPTDSWVCWNAEVSYAFQWADLDAVLRLRGVNLGDEDRREHVSFLKDVAPLGGRGIELGLEVKF